MGVDYSALTNKDKPLVVNALKNKYSINKLIQELNIKKSTYFYESKALNKDKYSCLRSLIKSIFLDNYECYGYRRIKAYLLIEHNITISEKVIRRIMKEESLIVKIKKNGKYSSYEGEISPEVPNIINRDFNIGQPYKKTLTDITEFALHDGKVYLSPLIDCYDGKPITYTIGKSPNSKLVNDMLIKAHDIMGETNALVHSDRGFHYRLDSWINLMSEYGYERSMSKTGCSPDNSMCEGFFGTIKNEFFYPRDFRFTTCDEFIPQLIKYLDWFITKRIKLRLIK